MKVSETEAVGLFERDGNLHFRTFNPNDLKVFDHIPGMYYKLNYSTSPMSGATDWWLSKSVKVADTPKKIYGDVAACTEKFISAFNRRTVPTGILLHGEKGNGKSIQIFHTCNSLVVQDVPVVLIDTNIPAAVIKSMVEMISKVSKIAVVFDEFDKYYTKPEEQNALLSLFSNRDMGKVMFFMAVNKYDEVSDYFKNRPSRLLISKNYNDINMDVARNIISDKVFDPIIRNLLTIHVANSKPNYDQIFEIIDNTIHCETPNEFVEMVSDLNISPFTRNLMFVEQVHRVIPQGDDVKDYKLDDVSSKISFDLSADFKTLTIMFDDLPDVIVLKEPKGFCDIETEQVVKTRDRINSTPFEVNGNIYFVKLKGTKSTQVIDGVKEIVQRCKDNCYKALPADVPEGTNAFTIKDLAFLLRNKPKPKSRDEDE